MNTLTTDLGSSIDPSENLMDAAMNLDSNGKVQAVVSRLVRSWRLLIASECNMKFFKSLLDKNISTRDIFSFVQKQANLRRIYKDLDKSMTKTAVRAKLNDACAFSIRQRRYVNKIKRDLLKATGYKRFKQKKIINQVRAKLQFEKKSQIKKDEIKVQRYASLQSKMLQEQQAQELRLPASIAHFQDLKAFGPDPNQTCEMDPPMVYDKSIVLSDDELKILSKGPKFAVRQKLVKESFKIELEKMSCKQKYSSGDDLENSTASAPSMCDDKSTPSMEWEERRSQLVYDFTEGSLEPRRLKATDYRFNRSVTLPKPSPATIEAKHELRKSESLLVFDKLVSTKQNSNSVTPFACKSNLSPSELRGLKSLQKRVASGNIVICESDKSAKLCVLSKEQYIAAGLEHCKNDLEVSSTDVKRLQTYVNANVQWLHEIFGSGSFWNHEGRIIASSNDQGSQVAPLRLLLKDHKPWNADSGEVIPS